MCWPTRISIFLPWSAPRRELRRGNAKGNARSAECSPLASTAVCSRAEDVQHVYSRTCVDNSHRQSGLQRGRTGGGLCRPSPPPSSATGATTQRGRERPPSQARQVPCRLTQEGRSRPRCAPVRPRAMRPVMTSLYRHVMPPALIPPVVAPRARNAGGTEPVMSIYEEPLCR
jgi:hypothetical protein